ncbi:MAG: M3 family metallopeptidase, partial [Thermoplasmata archaeon]
MHDRIVQVNATGRLEGTLRPFNEMMMHLDAASNEAGLLARVHPDAAVRKTAEESEQAVQKVLTELRLDKKLFDAFSTLDVGGADPATQFMCAKVLRDFRRAGVDKSAAERAKIAALNEEIVKLGQEFAKNIRENEREVVLDSLSELDGMPEDWIQKHSPGADGKIRVSTRYPDYYPYQTYARSAERREKLYREFKNRGYPKNVEVLKKLLTKRYDLAKTLGYRSWAEYITEDKMIGSSANARSFIDRIAEASKPAADRDYDMLLARKRKDAPGATKVEDWESAYYQQWVKVE